MTVDLNLNDAGRGSFTIEENGERVAEMVISVSSGNLTVFHTEVNEKLKGKGVSTQLLNAMVDYARQHNLKVIPLCAYVSAQFKRHPDLYQDIWNKTWKNK